MNHPAITGSNAANSRGIRRVATGVMPGTERLRCGGSMETPATYRLNAAGSVAQSEARYSLGSHSPRAGFANPIRG